MFAGPQRLGVHGGVQSQSVFNALRKGMNGRYSFNITFHTVWLDYKIRLLFINVRSRLSLASKHTNLVIIRAASSLMQSTQSRSSRGQQRVNFPQQPPQKFRATVVDAPLAQLFFCQGPALTSQSQRVDPALPHVGHLCHELRSVKEKKRYKWVCHSAVTATC